MQFDAFFREYHGNAFSVRTANGWSWSSSEFHSPRLIATFQTNRLLDTVIDSTSEAVLGRMFLEGNLDVQGDIFVLLSVAQYTLSHSEGLNRNLIQAISRFCFDVHRRLKLSSKDKSIRNWSRCPCPVDLPARFYEPWLGSELSHACAIPSGSREDFQVAQVAGLERACKSLELDRDERLLDLCCGWGTLLLHAAKSHGARVQGVTSSDSQAEIVADRICNRGLQAHAAVECRDIRSAPFAMESFDKIAHIGVFEQVRSCDLAEYFSTVQRMLAPRGLLTLHRITRSRQAAATALHSLCPDVMFEPLTHEMELAETAGFEILKLESLQPEYEFTLRTWIDHLRRNWSSGSGIEGNESSLERAQRAWLLYLIETTTYLASGELQIHSITLRRRTPVQKTDRYF